ncbi:MAG: hypothetical protein OEO23_12355, partial [Gemmatimonadota bacterium]|nr:hypothetical protein [Gemmatimonadota bacterium]
GISDDPPVQLLSFLGGQGTLPGHGFRAFAGRGYWLLKSETSVQWVPGWVTGRLVGGFGSTFGAPALPQSGVWILETTSHPRGFVGLGVGTLHDLIRVDGIWGIGPGGAFELVLSVDPRLGPYL